MSMRLAAASGAVTALVVVTVWLSDLSFERAVLLAPVLVIGLAALAGLIVFWGRVGWDSFKQARHPRLVIVAALSFVLLLLGLTLLGVQLPRE
jgi:hypothetical protein